MKSVLFVLGWVSFVVGFIGAFVPILPTTPFLILAAFLFSKSSPRFHKWVLELPLAGAAIQEWNEEKVIRPRAKILCSLMILLSLTFIWMKVDMHSGVKTFLTILLLSVCSFVVTRKSYPNKL